MSDLPDKKVIACNYEAGTKIAGEGALAYFCYGWTGGGYERVSVLVRSRGGRWIQKWEPIKRLTNFRLKTLPAEHPRYSDFRIMDSHCDDIYEPLAKIVGQLKEAKARCAKEGLESEQESRGDAE